MQTTVNLPDYIYHKSEALATSRGATVEEFIVEALKREIEGSTNVSVEAPCGDHEVELPLIRSLAPGRLDLNGFDFDDLLT